jgi:hemerythrin superfamily protein
MSFNLASRATGITTMIRMDHTHVLMLFRRYHPDTSASRKRALMTNACLALEIHAQLEEEIFYPALREVMPGSPLLDKSVPEHDEMRALITKLRNSSPDGDFEYDTNVRELMRTVLHHVADEESQLLPSAEELLSDELARLGAQMTRRRIQLLAPYAGEATRSTARSFPLLTGAVAVGVLTAGWMLTSHLRTPTRH